MIKWERVQKSSSEVVCDFCVLIGQTPRADFNERDRELIAVHLWKEHGVKPYFIQK